MQAHGRRLASTIFYSLEVCTAVVSTRSILHVDDGPFFGTLFMTLCPVP